MTSRNFSIETIGIVGTRRDGPRHCADRCARGPERAPGTTPIRLLSAPRATTSPKRSPNRPPRASSTQARYACCARQRQGRARDQRTGRTAISCIEAIVEKLDVKQALFRELETVVSGRCVLASNTSSLSITAIAAGCTDPSRVVGYHFFNPVPLMKVVEVIDGLRSDREAGDALMDLARRMGHTPVRAKDMPGFIVNHAGRGMNTEGLRVAGEGVASFVDIDRIMREQAGFRLGPFELLDLTALDVSHPVMESIYHQFYEEPRFTPSPITGTRLAGGLLGRKTGEGFYRYEDGKQQAPAEAPAPAALPSSVWVSKRYPRAYQAVVQLIGKAGVKLDEGAHARRRLADRRHAVRPRRKPRPPWTKRSTRAASSRSTRSFRSSARNAAR